MERTEKPILTERVDVLDGIRAVAVLIVVWYHVWQQSWLMPIFTTPSLARFGITVINLDNIPRTGYLFVDMMMLLSAFCLFLPHARAMQGLGPVPETRLFYRKRLARIVPSYVLSVLVIFFAWCLPNGVYASAGAAIRDLAASLTFTQTLSSSTYIGTQINGVLWTAAIEMQFYLVFPLLARAFRKKPALTYVLMVAASELYLQYLARMLPDTLRLTLNQLIGFLGVYANGFLGAWILVRVSRATSRRAYVSIPCTVLFVACLYAITRFQQGAATAKVVQVFQAEYRFLLSLVFLAAVLSLALSVRALRWLFANPVAKFLAAISYNLYIWHQWLAVRLKEWHIPAWTGDTPPNQAGNRTWMWQYTIVVFLAAIFVATLVTYAVEKPAAGLILHGPRHKAKQTDTLSVHKGEETK